MPFEEEQSMDEMLEEFENEWTGEESTEDTNESVQEVEETPTETEEETETPNPNDSDEHKRNQAFAALREQAETNQRYADLVKRIAETGGVTPEDLIARFEQQQLEAEAERQQIPVELLQRQTSTETELSQLKEQMRAERMDAQVNQAITKYGADDNSIRNAFQYMLESGVDPRVQDNVNFDHFYRAANLDSIIQKEVESSRQKDLDDKRKRQESASIGNGASVTPSSGDLSDEEFDEILAKMDMRI